MSKWNYFNIVTVDGYGFPENPQADFQFNSRGFALHNRGSYVIQYSFDGSTIHGDLNPTDETKGMMFDWRIENKVWFRAVGGFGTVRVEAWSD